MSDPSAEDTTIEDLEDRIADLEQDVKDRDEEIARLERILDEARGIVSDIYRLL